MFIGYDSGFLVILLVVRLLLPLLYLLRQFKLSEYSISGLISQWILI